MSNQRKNKKYTINDLKAFAESKGGKCLSTEYNGTHGVYLWEDHLGNRWEAKGYSIMTGGRWSPYLAKVKQRQANLKYKLEDLQEFAKQKNGKCLSSVYNTRKTKYCWEDSKGRPFLMSWGHVLTGQWSPHEKIETLSKLKNKYTLEDLQEFAKSMGGELLSDTYGAPDDTYVWKDVTGKTYSRTWNCVKKYTNFKFYSAISEAHQEIIDFIKDLGINNILINDRKIIKPKELDIYLPDFRIAIEYNGVNWHTEETHRFAHQEKYKLCKNFNIDLIQIFDVEWHKNKDAIKNYLKRKLNKCKYHLNFDEVTVREVREQEAKDFLKIYNIHGEVNFIKAYGLYNREHPDVLESLITVTKKHVKNKEYFLNSYCISEDTKIEHGLYMLVDVAKLDFPDITTWVDCRYIEDEFFRKPWKIIGEILPDYFYINNQNKKISKFSRQKHKVNTPIGMSEAEHAKLDGLTRVYDAGKLKLSFSPVKS